jgi:hypothetical protein
MSASAPFQSPAKPATPWKMRPTSAGVDDADQTLSLTIRSAARRPARATARASPGCRPQTMAVSSREPMGPATARLRRRLLARVDQATTTCENVCVGVVLSIPSCQTSQSSGSSRSFNHSNLSNLSNFLRNLLSWRTRKPVNQISKVQLTPSGLKTQTRKLANGIVRRTAVVTVGDISPTALTCHHAVT